MIAIVPEGKQRKHAYLPHTASLKETVAAIPKHDHYHFREDSIYCSMMANVIAYRIRVCSADHLFAKIKTNHLDELLRRYPYDKDGTRVFTMSYVFDKQLYRTQLSRRLKRQAEILEAAEECPDPWESCYVPPPDEPVTGMREVPRDILDWEYAAALEAASKKAKAQAEERRHRDPAPLSGGPSGKASSSSGVQEATFDEVVATMRYRTEPHRTFSAIKEAMTAEASSGFMKARPADYTGVGYQDDLDLMYMRDYDDEITCPSNPEGENMQTILPSSIPKDHLPEPRLNDNILHHITGLVRGSKQRMQSRVGKWELINVLWESRRINIGTRGIIGLVACDNKGRFNISGHIDDPRKDYVETEVWPTWICAGHNKKIQHQVTDADIAVACTATMLARSWGIQPPIKVGHFSPVESSRRGCTIARHMMTGFQPGYGNSGKFRNYFAKATLNELENRAGSRANLPFEIVLSTEEVNEVAYLFETTSEGVLTRDFVPGSCILYIRDTNKGAMPSCCGLDRIRTTLRWRSSRMFPKPQLRNLCLSPTHSVEAMKKSLQKRIWCKTSTCQNRLHRWRLRTPQPLMFCQKRRPCWIRGAPNPHRSPASGKPRPSARLWTSMLMLRPMSKSRRRLPRCTMRGTAAAQGNTAGTSSSPRYGRPPSSLPTLLWHAAPR